MSNGAEILLKSMVETVGLAEVAKKVGYSKSAVCHVMNGTYKGRAGQILDAVRAAYDQTPVACPILGEITVARCSTERSRPFAATNPQRVRLARTCPSCEVKQ